MVAQPDLSHVGLTDLRKIGDGGFGSVYAARQAAFEREVAVKVLDAKIHDPSVRARFERECRALGKLSAHPNIVTVFDSGFTQDRPYLVMEFVKGGSLADRVSTSGKVRAQQATSAGVSLAGAIETAHRSGVLHRDVKPENVLLSDYGAPLLADFGIARLDGGPSTTTTGKVTTSIAHAAPEIFDAGAPAANWDTYALGSTLFTVLAGRYAFVEEGVEMLAILRRIFDYPVPDLRPEGVPDPLADIIERSMAKKPDDRYASALGLGRALQQLQRDQGWSVTPLLVPGEPPEGEAPDPVVETVAATRFLSPEELATPAPIPDWGTDRPGRSSAFTPGASPPQQSTPPPRQPTPPPRQPTPPPRQPTPPPRQPQPPTAPVPTYVPAGPQQFAQPQPPGYPQPPYPQQFGPPVAPKKSSSAGKGCLIAFLILVGFYVLGVIATLIGQSQGF